jgi:iron(III) transport system ATP-binding protein
VAAVRDVSLTVEPGELVTLLGPSGCGKTTTLRIAAGFEQPDAGRVLIGGRDVTGHEVYRRSIGFVFQNYALFPHLTVFENVAYGLRVKGLRRDAIRQQVGRVLELVGLPGHAGRFPNQLAGGEQQRVAVARAVVVEPELLLFDEPLSNLDAKLRVQMRGELSRLQRQLGITTNYVTHDQEEAMAISDRIAVMRGGRIAQMGTAHDLYSEPRSIFVAQFVGRVNLLPSRVVLATGDTIHVELWGQPVQVKAAVVPAAGSAVSIALRPESVNLAPERAVTSERDVGTIGLVRARTFLGEKVEYVVDAGPVTIEAVIWDPSRRGAFDLGARVRVSCEPASLRLLVDDEAKLDEGSTGR